MSCAARHLTVMCMLQVGAQGVAELGAADGGAVALADAVATGAGAEVALDDDNDLQAAGRCAL